MKRLVIMFFLGLITLCTRSQVMCDGQQELLGEDGECNYNPYVLVFEDNFDGATLDLSKWQIQPWAQGSLQGDESNQYYSLDNVTLDNGICYITAKKETVVRRAVSYLDDTVTLEDGLPNLRSYDYTSSNIWTKQKFEHGKFEIRCKIPDGKGFWPAFWVNGEENQIRNEIDVFEFWKDNTNNHNMTIHYVNSSDTLQCLSDYNGPDYSEAFHVFTVIWDRYKVEWYVDGVLKRTSPKYVTLLGQTVDCNGVQAWHTYIKDKLFPHLPMHIIVNLALQTGDYAPDATTPFPSSFEIDYIRYYKQMACEGIIDFSSDSELNLNDDVYNFLMGSEISLGGNISIQNGQQLKMEARDVIRLLPGFTTFQGSDVTASINENICQGSFKYGYDTACTSIDNPLPKFSIIPDRTERINNEMLPEIKIYPNPNSGIFSVFIENGSSNFCFLYITNTNGSIIESYKISNNSLPNLIDICDFENGIYFLYFVDTLNQNVGTYKIIKK